MNDNHKPHRTILKAIAHREMLKRGFLPDFSTEVLAELDRSSRRLKPPVILSATCTIFYGVQSITMTPLTSTSLLSRKRCQAAGLKILVAIADVDSLVRRGSEIDGHGLHNTSSIYTAAAIFPMLPEKLSTNLTSLNIYE